MKPEDPNHKSETLGRAWEEFKRVNASRLEEMEKAKKPVFESLNPITDRERELWMTAYEKGARDSNRRHYEGRPAVEGKPLELQTRDELLACIRQHQAEVKIENDRICVAGKWFVPAKGEGDPVIRREMRDNAEKNERYLIGKMVDAANEMEGVEVHPDCMAAALKAIRPYLRTTEPAQSNCSVCGVAFSDELPREEHQSRHSGLKPVSGSPDALSCLKRLVALKEHKDEHGKDAYYEFEQPIAWREAKAVLDAVGVKYVQ